MVRYAYNRQVTPPAPFVHVSVRAPYDGSAGVEIPGQLDIGADVAVIPSSLIDALKLMPLDSILAVGFGGQVLTVPTYLVELCIRGLSPVTIKVIASPDEERYALLGRDLLNRFRISLDGPNLAVELS